LADARTGALENISTCLEDLKQAWKKRTVSIRSFQKSNNRHPNIFLFSNNKKYLLPENHPLLRPRFTPKKLKHGLEEAEPPCLASPSGHQQHWETLTDLQGFKRFQRVK